MRRPGDDDPGHGGGGGGPSGGGGGDGPPGGARFDIYSDIPGDAYGDRRADKPLTKFSKTPFDEKAAMSVLPRYNGMENTAFGERR